MNKNPSIQDLEQIEDEFIKNLASFKAIEQKLFQDLQQGNLNNKEKYLQNMRDILGNLNNILNEMKSMIKTPFNKGLNNENNSKIASTQLLHQSFNLDKAATIYQDAKIQFETLIGERDNTKLTYDSNKSSFLLLFLVFLAIITILILHFKGYNIFDNYYIYGLFILIIYLYFEKIKQIYNYISNIFV